MSEGYRCIGYDIEAHEYWLPEEAHDGDGSKGTKPVEKRGWTQGCAITLGLEGENQKPRNRLAKYPGELRLKSILDLDGAELADATCIVASPSCQRYSYMAMPWSRAKEMAVKFREDIGDLNDLFNACFRIQREASAASGRLVPLVVENVKGAQPWVGRAAWHYGSFYLWGDVPALMPTTLRAKVSGMDWSKYGEPGYKAVAFNAEAVR